MQAQHGIPSERPLCDPGMAPYSQADDPDGLSSLSEAGFGQQARTAVFRKPSPLLVVAEPRSSSSEQLECQSALEPPACLLLPAAAAIDGSQACLLALRQFFRAAHREKPPGRLCHAR